MNSFVGRELLNAARQHGAGLLVIGGRSRSRVAAAASEKVTGYLVRRSPVPVLVVGEEPPAGAAGSAGRDG
jgi:nucleotide-binding universal stress UspA family protein